MVCLRTLLLLPLFCLIFTTLVSGTNSGRDTSACTWNPWSSWSGCTTAQCGAPIQIRQRTCPCNFKCLGNNQQTRICQQNCTYSSEYWQAYYSSADNKLLQQPWPIAEHTTFPCGDWDWLSLMTTTKSSPWYRLAKEYTAARLNVAAGNSIDDKLEQLLQAAEPVLLSCNRNKNHYNQTIPLADGLEDFNMGRESAPLCNFVPCCYYSSEYGTWSDCDCLGLKYSLPICYCPGYTGATNDSMCTGIPSLQTVSCEPPSNCSDRDYRNKTKNCAYEWSKWSDCQCGGNETRAQLCICGRTDLAPAARCPGQALPNETRSCPKEACHHECSYSNTWGPWSNCSSTCNKTRAKNCVCPLRGAGSVDPSFCRGSQPKETTACKDDANCVSCDWDQWGDWSECSQICGTGYRWRAKLCSCANNNNVTVNVNSCSGQQPMEQSECNVVPCCFYDVWGHWSECSQNCGGGTKWRKKICRCPNYPDGSYNDLTCSGSLGIPTPMEQQTCNSGSCCYFTDFTDWSACSSKCGGGVSTRQQRCSCPDTPGKYVDNSRCSGTAQQASKRCNMDPCPQPQDVHYWATHNLYANRRYQISWPISEHTKFPCTTQAPTDADKSQSYLQILQNAAAETSNVADSALVESVAGAENDPWFPLAAQYIAAVLNLARGSIPDTNIQNSISSAQSLLADCGDFNDDEITEAQMLTQTLLLFNTDEYIVNFTAGGTEKERQHKGMMAGMNGGEESGGMEGDMAGHSSEPDHSMALYLGVPIIVIFLLAIAVVITVFIMKHRHAAFIRRRIRHMARTDSSSGIEEYI